MARLPRRRPLLKVTFPNVREGSRTGVIRYNAADNSFCAHCPHDSTCRLTRTANARGATAQGRPLGLLSALLLRHSEEMSADNHKASFCLQNVDELPNVEERRSGRQHFKELPGAQEFLALERYKRAEEDSEPENL
eukprot:14120468-Heterocapsa_arctica.AAC.1